MNELIAQLTLFQVGVPSALILLNVLVVPTTWLGFLFRVVGIAALLVYTALSGVWLFPPWWTPYLLGTFHIAGSALAYKRMRQSDTLPATTRKYAELAVGLLLCVTAFYILLPALLGRTAPSHLVALDSPLESGRYLIMSGGTTGAINAHLMTLDAEKFAAYRGQSYAVDIIGIDKFGRRADGISPQDPMAYYIYGKNVLAPCDGLVRRTADGIPDMIVPKTDREHMLGNHVLLECDGSVILLAHMSLDSVKVKLGDHVLSGDVLGAVGNSGNTEEPHLHIHVQKSLPDDNPISGEPIWFTIKNQFLARNDRLVIQ